MRHASRREYDYHLVMPRTIQASLAFVVVAACGSKKEPAPPPPKPPAADAAAVAADAAVAATAVAADAAVAATADAATPDPCSPEALGLAGTTTPTAWTPPAGCAVKPATADQWIRSEADFAKHVACPKDVKSGVDFTKQMIGVARRMLTGSNLGFTAYDDGKTITIVGRFNERCPDPPGRPPVPKVLEHPETFWFLVPAAPERKFADAGCKYPCKS